MAKKAYLGFAFQEIPMKQIESIFGVSYLCCSGRSDPVRIGVERPPVPTTVEDQLLLLPAGLPLDLPLKKTPKRTHYAHFFLDCCDPPFNALSSFGFVAQSDLPRHRKMVGRLIERLI